MLIELGNHAPKTPTVDGAPAVTEIHFPEADDGSTHDDAIYRVGAKEMRVADFPDRILPDGSKLVKAGPASGGYTHAAGAIKVQEFKDHMYDAIMNRDGITRLPDHEILVSLAQSWPSQGRRPPEWVNVIEHHDGLTPKGRADDLTAFLQEYWNIKTDKPANFEDVYHTRFGGPGQCAPLGPPPITNTFVNTGRVIANLNDGGGQVGAGGAGTAATATSLTTASTYTTNQWAGYRVVAYSTTANNMVWGNVLSNTNAAGASVLTVDRWYVFATPGGAAGTTPTTPWAFSILDGGAVSAWFVGLATGANAAVVGDITLNTNGNVEYVTALGGYLRKISPYAQTSGISPRGITLSPVYTGNASDAYPQTFTIMGAFVSMVPGAAGTMKFEGALNASATVAAVNDQVSLVETLTGS